MFWYVEMLMDVVRGRVAALRADDGGDRGASALEWAIIAAVAVVLAGIVGAVIYNAVQTQSGVVKSCTGQAVTTECGGNQ